MEGVSTDCVVERVGDVAACSEARPCCDCEAAMGVYAGEADVRRGRAAEMGGVVGQWRLWAPEPSLRAIPLGAHAVHESAKLAARCSGLRWRAHACSHRFDFTGNPILPFTCISTSMLQNLRIQFSTERNPEWSSFRYL